MRGTRDFASMSNPSRNGQFSRRWAEPQHVGKVAEAVADDIGRQAISHHLAQAADLEGPEAEAAFEIADNIRASMGLTWAEVIGLRSAA